MILIVTAISAVIICVLTFWIRWRKKRMSLFLRHGIPGPTPDFIFGNMKEYILKREKGIGEWIEKYGNIFGFYLGGKPWIICTDLELLKLVQIKESRSFVNRDTIIPDMGIPHKLIYNALPFRTDEDWKMLRTILSNSFSSGKIKTISSLMSEAIQIFLNNIQKQNGNPFDISESYKKLTFDITCRSSFGFKSNVQNEETSKFIQSVYKIFEVDSSDVLAEMSFLFPEFEPVPTYLRNIVDALKNLLNYPCVRVVFDTCRKIVVSRKQSGYYAPDLLQTLIDAEDESGGGKKALSTNSVIANAVFFMAASYDTTSSTLAWCTYFLSENSVVQEKLRQEINENIENNRGIEYADLSNLKYLDQIISETLRLYPLNSITVARKCSEDFRYKNMIIPKGVTIAVPMSYLHYNNRYWDESKIFNPDRFSNKDGIKIDSTVYQPFGSGPRSCIGIRLAQTVMKLILANLIRSYRIESYGDEDMKEIESSFFINRPKNGIIIKAFPITL